MKRYNHKLVERKWQNKWIRSKIYEPSLAEAKKPFFNLMMFPYPSAEGLHVGNMYAFTGADIYGRFNRMLGFDVFEPIGLDGFGIHSENYAIKVGRHPREHAKISEKNFYRQLHEIGNSFDWGHTLETYDPDYYKWTQWLFIKMWEAGLAYKDKTTVNWCPSCKTVLADEQVIQGHCERCGTSVVRREMSSWFFRITKYSDQLLKGLKTIKWPEKIKHAQREWIGKSEGVRIEFQIPETKSKLPVFTTRPDTILGVTFLAVSPEKAQSLLEFIPEDKKGKVSEYIKESLAKNEQARKKGEKEKTGVNTGFLAVNPVTQEKISVWVADYVLADVGTGIVMGVPNYDERDKDFAEKHKLKITEKRLYKAQVGTKETRYHLRDWGISRQRYWGPPIPMVNCQKCGWQSVPESDLPVLLPDIKDFKPKGDGVSPLSNAPDSWKKVGCPKCGGQAERELDVLDTFLDSSWYFLAYPNLGTKEWKDNKTPFNKEITNRWFPVDAYIGGAEHAVLHLLYARFVWKVLYDRGLIDKKLGNEPFPFLFGHGLIIKDGAKMSKSKGNIVVPDKYIEKYGADTLRTYLMFLGAFDQGGDFRDTGIEGMRKFVNRLSRLFVEYGDIVLVEKRDSEDILLKIHQTIKKVTEDIQELKYNTAIAAIMEFVNLLYDKTSGNIKRADGKIHCAEWDEALRVLAKLIAPFTPHLAEEVWVNVLGENFSVHKSSWPTFNPELIKEEEVTILLQVDGKLRNQLTVNRRLAVNKKEIEKIARKDEKIVKWLKNKKIRNTVFVPGRVINFVTK